MIFWLTLGLFFATVSFVYPLTPILTLDLLPSFIGFLLIWYVASRLSEKSRWFADAGTASAVFAMLHFIGFAGYFIGFLPQNTTFADSDILRFILTGVNYVYSNGFLIFASLVFISALFLCRAFGAIAEDGEKRGVALFFYIFSWIFTALVPIFIVASFITLPFDIQIISYPIMAIFVIASALFMKKNNLD